MGTTATIGLLTQSKKRGKGGPRKPQLLLMEQTVRPSGNKYSAGDIRWLLDRVEQRRVDAAKAGGRHSDAGALRAELIDCWRARYRKQGLSDITAASKAKAEADGRLDSLKVLLSRARKSQK